LYSYYSTLNDEGDEIDWDQRSDEEFESKMEKLKVKERERITHWDISLGRYKDLAFRACDKSKYYCRPLVKYPPVDVFQAEQGGISTVFCRPDQCSLTNSYVDDNSCFD
jgi:hypothetical protein